MKDKIRINNRVFLEWLQNRFPEMVGKGPEYAIRCFAREPFHNVNCWDRKTKLAINVEKGKFQCWLCQYRGSAIRLVRDFEHISWEQAEEFLVSGTEHTPLSSVLAELSKLNYTFDDKPPLYEIELPEYYEELHPSVYRIYRHYATIKRGLSWETIYRHKIGYCHFGPFAFRIIIPIYQQGKLVSFAARAVTSKQEPKVRFPYKVEQSRILFNYDLASHQKEMVLTEGIFQALRVGPQGVAVFGSKLSDAQMVLLSKAKAKRYTVMFDADKPGQRGGLRVYNRLRDQFGNKRVKLVSLPEGDPDEYEETELFRLMSKPSEVDHLSRMWQNASLL